MNPHWAPSRFRYAALKLLAYVVAPRSRGSEVPRLLNFAPDQNAFGVMSLAWFVSGVYSLYVMSWTAWIFQHGGMWRAAACIFLLAASANFTYMVLPLFPLASSLGGAEGRKTDRGVIFVGRVITNAATLLSAATLHYQLPGRAAAIIWLVGVSINLVAAALVRTAFRSRIEHLERTLQESARFEL